MIQIIVIRTQSRELGYIYPCHRFLFMTSYNKMNRMDHFIFLRLYYLLISYIITIQYLNLTLKQRIELEVFLLWLIFINEMK